METLKVKLIGQGDLLTHNVQLANPLLIWAKEIKKHSGKRNKTEADLYWLARLEWEGGLYLKDGVVTLPHEVVYKTFLNGARKSKNGKLFESGAQILSVSPLEYAGQKITKTTAMDVFPSPELDGFFEEHSFITMVVVSRSRILRARPRFKDWNCEVEIIFNPEIISRDVIFTSIKNAGYLVGMGDWRPLHGKFIAEK